MGPQAQQKTQRESRRTTNICSFSSPVLRGSCRSAKSISRITSKQIWSCKQISTWLDWKTLSAKLRTYSCAIRRAKRIRLWFQQDQCYSIFMRDIFLELLPRSIQHGRKTLNHSRTIPSWSVTCTRLFIHSPVRDSGQQVPGQGTELTIGLAALEISALGYGWEVGSLVNIHLFHAGIAGSGLAMFFSWPVIYGMSNRFEWRWKT